MFEGLVKRMLDTYLAPYVDGITQNLQMAVWSGNISLENLTLKDDITSRLALPFHHVSGKIGSINIRIPWASIGTTPIKIVIDSVYICIDNRSTKKTDEEILAHLRKKKNNLISLLEHEYFELANLQSEGKLSSSYIIKLSQKILNNIQIDFTNIHLQFFDEHSSFAFKIDSIFVRKSRGDESMKSLRLKTNDEFREEPVTHVCSLLGFSIYETKFKIPKEEINSKTILQIIVDQNSSKLNNSEHEENTGLLMLEPLSFRLYLAINAKNKSIYASLCIGSIVKNQSRSTKEEASHRSYIRNIRQMANRNNREADAEYSESEKEEEDTLKIVLTSDVIRTFTKMWVDINTDRKRGRRLLMAKANEVKLDHEALKKSTKAEFIKLYTKYKLSATEGKEEDAQELERLQDLIDLVPARYIARWKFACKRRTSAQVVTKENKSWFKWAKNIVTTTYTNYHASRNATKNEEQQSGQADQGRQRRSFRSSFFSLTLNNTGMYFDTGSGDNVDSGRLEGMYERADAENHIGLLENLPGGLVLTDDEIKMIQETISLEELFEDSYTTSSYYFECVLPAFQFIVHMLSHQGGKTARTGEDDVMLIDIQNLQSRIFMHAVVDMKDKDRYEGYFDLNLDSFDVVLKDKKIMTFSQQNLPFQSIVDTYIDHEMPESLYIGRREEATGAEADSEGPRLLKSISEAENSIINLRVYHKIAKKGNVLVVNGELRPIETNVFPELIPVFFEIMSLFKPIKKIFKEDFKMEAYSYSTCPSNITLASVTNEEEDDEVLSSSQEVGETMRELEHAGSKDVDSIQFINFDIKFSAPILILYHENSKIDFYFGTLVLKSNGDCPIANIDGTLELKQTQVTVNHRENVFNFLRPLPVKIHYYLDVKNELLNLNVIFEELFAQLEPMATSILFKVPSEIIKILIKNMTQESQSVDEASELRSRTTSRKENKLKYYKICSNVLIRHSGFAVANLSLHDIFKLDMYNVSIKMTNTLESSNFSLSLESIIISNPTTKIPLFKTINANPEEVSSRFSSMGSNGHSGDYVMESDLSIVKFSSIGEGNEGELSVNGLQDWENSGLSKKSSLIEREAMELEEEYVDAVEDVSKSLDLEIVTNIVEDTAYNAVNISIIEMEGNWEYSTIKLIADGFQEYKDVLTNDIADTTFTTITTTFKTFKDKFMFHSGGTQANQATRGGKQGESAQEEEDLEDDIEGFCIHDELPLLESELKEDGMKVVTKCKLVIKGASILFNNSTGDIIAKLSVGRIEHQLAKFKNNEKIINLVIQTGKLYFGGRCILSHLSTTYGDEQGPDDATGAENLKESGKMSSRDNAGTSESDNLLVLNLKCYNSTDLPYSMCFEGKVDKVIFVYFQHDINRFMEYFDDGILSVFLSKSYHKVVQRADEMRFFYHFSVTSPIFIFPENKAVLPNGKSHYKQELPPGSTLPLYSTGGRNEVQKGSDKQIRNIANVVDLWYFGSYVLFELGHLEFKNSYSKLVDKHKSTIFLKMLGTKAQIVQQKRGTAGIEGVVLDATDLKVCTRGRDLMEIGVDSEALVTKLTRNQLTFLIDVFNENIGGAVYMVSEGGTNSFTQNFPTKRESRYLIRLSLNKFQLYCYNNLNSNREVGESRENGGAEEKQVRFANVEARKDDVIPLGLFEFTDITCCLDYASNNVKLLSYYQFGFISKSLTVTDLRENSFNKHKTLLKCNKPSIRGTYDGVKNDREKEAMRASVNGLLFEWLRNYKSRTGNDFFKINEANFAARTGSGSREEENKGSGEEEGFSSATRTDYQDDAIKCVVNSDPEESLIDVIVSNSEIPLLFVFFFDLLRFFSLSYGTSSMALFPKISQVNVERVYILNLLVSKSKFISFSKMDKVDCPRLELVTDFILQMYVNGNLFKFTKLDIIDCLLSRVYANTNVSQVLCGNFLMYGKGHYVSDLASKMFFQFTIPQINLRLYTRDLSIIIHCFKSMFTDGPSVIPVKLVNNQLIDDNSSKFLTMSFDIKGLEMLFFDDLKKSVIPLVKLTVESEKLEILNLPIEKRYSLIRCNCHLYYFNTNVGDWEPFIEKFIFNLEYITNPTGNGARAGSQMQSRMSTQMERLAGKRGSDDAIWKDFVSDYQLKVTCNSNLMVNITPNFCQMLLYFLPILKSNLLHPTFMNSGKVEEHSDQQRQDGREEDDIEMSNYRYVNLTSYEYYGFIMDVNKSRREAFSDVLNIVSTTTPKQLDALVNQLDKEVSSNEYCIYLVTKPPKYVLKQIAQELSCSESLVQSDLLASGSIMRTRSNLSNANYASSHATMNGEFNRSLFCNNGMVLSNIPLSKNCTVLLSVPIKDIGLFNALYADGEERGGEDERAFSHMSSINTETSGLNRGVDYPSLNAMNPNGTLSASQLNQRGSLLHNNMMTTRSSNVTLRNSTSSAGADGMPHIRNNRVTNINESIVNNNIICQVLSPHPSHKLLLFTSTVRIYNKSGMPVVMCFLDYGFNHQYMYNLNERTIPCNLLNQNDMQNFKQYTAGNIYSDQSEVSRHSTVNGPENDEGYFVVIPNDHMLSVPENVFLADSQIIFSFKPLYRAKDREDTSELFSRLKRSMDKEPSLKQYYNKLVNTTGWCKMVDSSHHSGTRVRQCYCPDLGKNGFLYFVVSVDNKRSSLPANINVSEIVIYPSISVMNTLPIDLDIKLLSKDYNLQATKHARDSQAKDDITYKLNRKGILHIYSVPPNESLALYIRLSASALEDLKAADGKNVTSEWCSRIDNIYGNSDSRSTFSVAVNGSVLELELIRFAGALPVNNLCIQGHLSLIINAPWLFIDRTGLSLVPQHYNRVFTLNNLSFLYDNNNNNYKLVSLNSPGAARYSLRLDRRYSSSRHGEAGFRADEYFDDAEYDIKMPIIGGYGYTSIEIKGKRHCVCLITEKVYIPGLSHISSKVTSALPEYLFTNNLAEVVYLRKDARSESIQIMPNSTQSISHLTNVNYLLSQNSGGVGQTGRQDYKENCIEIKVGMETCWSSVIYLSEIYSGETFMSLSKENSSKSQVYNITIIPKNGIKYIAINATVTPAPSMLSASERTNGIRGYLLYNNSREIKVVMIRTFHKKDVKNGACFTAKHGQVINFGWPNPFVHKSKLVQVLLWLDKNTVAPSKPLIFNFSTPSFRFRRIELTTPEYHTNYNITILAENRIDYYIIIINPNAGSPQSPLAHVSTSATTQASLDEIDDNVLLDNKHISDLRNEDMYVFDEEAAIRSYQVVLQISQIGVSIVSQSQHEELFFLEMGGIMSLFMCKEDHQRLELKITDVQLDNQTELEMGKTILVNRSKVETSDANFLQVYIDRPFSNCKDISIKKMFVSLDDLQVDFNDLLFTKMHSYYKECMINLHSSVNRGADGGGDRRGGSRPGLHKGGRIDIEVIEGWLNMEKNSPTSSIEVNVSLPRSISIDYLYIEAFSLVVWCCFELEKLHMLGDLLRVGLRILSVSRNFELMGAPISFQREYVTISRTSVLSFWEQMKDKYLQASLSCIGSILGYSNLLNIPKLPLTVGRCTIELAADAVDSVSSGLGLVLSKFTFDKEYMKKRSTAREVTSIKDGLFSAGKTIGEGLFSLTNIVTKPIEGAQKEGVEGFIKGLGKGLLGSIVKPIDKVGIAVSQVSRGIKANISKEEKFLVDQCRKPRMLWGEFAQIRGYSAQDAEIRDLLGVKYAKHIMDCLLIIRQQTGSKAKQVALLFYPSKVYLVDLSQSHGRKPYTIWKLQITNITEVRASSHGVIIKCGLEQYQVPCTRADMISNIHNSFQRAIKHASSQITLGPELFISA
ncbi:conserved hypothetical protein [Theileria orientalis strain Shintoku]|uniref:Chorein N-terminal domain-containing protein n=1 Tax=Theileria orientalis strain Shintoku TaxID=869250 RepID=J4C3S3_THEOR|nr:conserved hypothetical protein [Theileria orientalis strain Shintoku]BAM40941.1 conserved hypothetical protein [Theileria orientalis strain Shintoku]|eukprot:XP_009691242.1 conserved hypothetical protein [Theileria orientalis strain Shintoku]